MRKLFFPALLLMITSVMTACGDGAPSEEEIRSRYSGLFCDGFYKTELKPDGTYAARRTMRGFATGSPVAERCEGKYTFVHESGVWKIVFEKSTENSNQLVSCGGDQVIWEKEKGYISTDTVPELKDLFEGKTLRKNNCE